MTAPVGFVGRHGAWGAEEHAAREQAARVIEEVGIERVRVVFADLHGSLRGKTLTSAAYEQALVDGVRVPSSLLLKDTAGRTVQPVFDPDAGLREARLAGASDIVLVPDPTTFRALPWAPRTAWVLCDVHYRDGEPVEFSPRQVARRVLDELDDRGWNLDVGIELEFHVFEQPADGGDAREAHVWPPTGLVPMRGAYQLLSEVKLDRIEPLVDEFHRRLAGLGLDIRTFETEFGPSQFEVTLGVGRGLRPADDVMLLRSALRQVARRAGYLVTFMCRPAQPEVMSSGWHLHQSLVDKGTGRNIFADDDEDMSSLARSYLGGLLRHAPAASVFTTPTVNGYKRFRPYSLAPDRIVWGNDNKGAMLRLVGGPGQPATRLENRSGEPCANPYLYLASQVVCGLAGIDGEVDPGPGTTTPYTTAAPRLPGDLATALAALEEDDVVTKGMGPSLVSNLLDVKRAELERFQSHVTDWEQAEYLDAF